MREDGSQTTHPKYWPKLDPQVHAAALYVSLLKNGYHEEATEFAEWWLETFDHDLED